MPFSQSSIVMPSGKTKKARKNWTIIDTELFARLMREGRAKGILPSDHDGKCLYQLEARVCVSSALGAYTERQARLYASNGGSWAALNLLKKNGQPFSRKFCRERVRFVAIERRVLGFLRGQAAIDWNIAAVRRKMFELFGEGILEHLCTTFNPREETMEQMRARALREAHELDRSAGKKQRLLPDGCVTPWRTYKIVDLDDFRNRRYAAHAALKRARVGNPAAELRGVHEGELLKTATSIAGIKANCWQRAIDLFRMRVQGTFGVLGYDRYVALSESEWSRVIQLKSLPDTVSRDALRKEALKVPVVRPKKSAFPDKNWWRLYEPGCDDGQYALTPLLFEGEKELFNFPPRNRRVHRETLIELTPAMRNWRPKRAKCKRMIQLKLHFHGQAKKRLPIRKLDPERPDQYLLFDKGTCSVTEVKCGRKKRHTPIVQDSQTSLPFIYG
ncbi:MAG: hypothetical protein ABH861_04160 [Patescibacteria group bacterium]|nr:hypothetical protein [Patescibacteria group bacterium]MBU1035004.1 hypothetical protein [Patescibacteria group bacterium]